MTKNATVAPLEEAALIALFSFKLANQAPDSSGRHFFGFGQDIKLREVYLGPETFLGKKDVEEVLGDQSIPVIPTRRAFQRFNVVRQRDEILWKLRQDNDS